MLRNYLVVALRNLRRNKTFSFINISGLALGMTCFMTILLYVRFELSFDEFHQRAGRIFKLVEIQSFQGRGTEHIGVTQGPMGPTMLADYPEVADFARFWYASAPLVEFAGAKVRVADAFYADPSFLRMFTFPAVAGDQASALDEPGGVALTAATARKIFGEADPLGRVVRFHDRDHTIRAVLAAVPRNSSLQFGMLISSETLRGGDEPPGKDWGDNWLTTFLLLADGADPAALEAKFPGFLRQYVAHSAEHYQLYLHPLEKVHLHSAHIKADAANWGRGDIAHVYIFSLIAVFVLLIACINFINLSTARSAGRAREVGMRKTVGARRRQLVGQFLGESVLTSSLALLLALGLLELAVPLFNLLSGLDLAVEPSHLPGILAATLLVGALSGSYPALFLASFQPARALKGSLREAPRSLRLRKGLVLVQFLVSAFLVVGTALVAQQFWFMLERKMGFDKDHVVTLWLTEDMQRDFAALASELRRHPAIVDVAVGRHRFGQFFSESGISFAGEGPEDNWLAPRQAVGANFIPFYGLELVAGRNFASGPPGPGSPAAYIINETLAGQLGWDEAVGKKFKLSFYGEWGTVVGVVKDFNFYSLHHEIEPLVLYRDPDDWWSLSVKVRPEGAGEALKHMRQVWTARAPDHAFSYEFLDDNIGRLYATEARAGKVLGLFAALAIAIACLGMFGLALYATERRTKEIGIRKALGASVANILALMSREFATLVVLANLIAWPLSYAAAEYWLAGFAYRIDVGAGVFLLGGALTIGVALLTVGAQAARAARAKPADSLRDD